MSRSLRLTVGLFVVACASLTPLFWAQAEQSGSRIIVLPLRGPGGVIARNEIANAVEPSVSYLRKVGAKAAQRPSRTARQHKANAMIGGRIRCPGRRCIVDVHVYRRSGQVWTKGTKRATRANIGQVAAELGLSLITDIGLATGGGEGEGEGEGEGGGQDEDFDNVDFDFAPEDDGGNHDDDDDDHDDGDHDDGDHDDGDGRDHDDGDGRDHDDDGRDHDDDDRDHDDDGRDHDDEDGDNGDDDDFDMDDFDDENTGRGRRGSSGHDFDALEVYFNADLTVARNLCLDLAPELQNDIDCDRQNPAYDDRTYTVRPYMNLGFRLSVFPGAFFDRRAWWAHWGLWADFGHSLVVRNTHDYETPEDPGPVEPFTRDIPTLQQDFRIGLMYRLAVRANDPTAVQIRFMAGVGFYEFRFDDSAYPQDVDIRLRYHPSNPYLPTFKYNSFDLGVQLRIPIQGYIFPYMNFFYRATLGTGQADRIYGDDSSVKGIDWEVAVAIELGLGIRLQAGFELIWYQTSFAGNSAYEGGMGEEEQLIWGGDSTLGDSATDLIFRFRVGVGWAF